MAKEKIHQMLAAIQREANWTRTENGALTYQSSGSACLDLFGTIGALRSEHYEEILTRFIHAWTEDKNLAMKIASDMIDMSYYIPGKFGLESYCEPFRAVLKKKFISMIENGDSYWNEFEPS